MISIQKLAGVTAGLTKTSEKLQTSITAGVILTGLEYLFGTIDRSLIWLAIFMVLDFITGIWVAAKEHKVSSRACVEGIFRKLVIMIYVMAGHGFDVVFNTEWVRIGVCYMYIASETISLIENGTKLGVPVPEPLKKALAIANDMSKKDDSEDKE